MSHAVHRYAPEGRNGGWGRVQYRGGGFSGFSRPSMKKDAEPSRSPDRAPSELQNHAAGAAEQFSQVFVISRGGCLCLFYFLLGARVPQRARSVSETRL